MVIVWWVEWAGDYYFTTDSFAAKTKWQTQNSCGYPATIYCTKEEWCTLISCKMNDCKGCA